MTTAPSSMHRPIKQGLLGFLLTFLVMQLLLTGQLLIHYKYDIFEKNLDGLIIIKCVLLLTMDVVTLSLPISIMVMTAVYYRQLFRNGETVINLKNALLPSAGIAFVFFLWAAFLAPINKSHLLSMLYDIRMVRENEVLIPTNFNIFKDDPHCQNYFQLGATVDSLTSDKPYMNESNNTQFVLIDTKVVNRLNIERAKMVGLPIMIFILFYTGMFLGILNQKNRLIFLLLGLYVIILPAIYYLGLYFEWLAKRSKVSPFEGQYYYLSILTVLTLGLFFIARHQTNKTS